MGHKNKGEGQRQVNAEKLGNSISKQAKTAGRSSKKGKNEHVAPDSDEHFAFIAGYTAGGFPYGVTWEGLEKIEGFDAALSTGPGGKT